MRVNNGKGDVNMWNLCVWLPGNLVAILLCDGIPHLKVLGYLNFIVGTSVVVAVNNEWNDENIVGGGGGGTVGDGSKNK